MTILYTDEYSQILLANRNDLKGRTIAYEVSIYELEEGGIGYGSVQKGTLKAGIFTPFGRRQRCVAYFNFGLACRATSNIALDRIAAL